MKAGIFLTVMLLGGCGDSGPVANQTPSVSTPTPQIAAPIGEADTAQQEATESRPQPATEPKPLVSRETPPRRTDTAEYRAIGTEPFWAVTVREQSAILQRPDHSPLRYSVSRSVDDRAIRYIGDGFAMKATQGPCSDGMSDAIWSDHVQVSFGEGTLKGCGGVREDDGGIGY